MYIVSKKRTLRFVTLCLGCFILSGFTQTNSDFRNQVIQYVELSANNILKGNTLPIPALANGAFDKQYEFNYWQPSVSIYQQGKRISIATAEHPKLSNALFMATQKALTNTNRENQNVTYRVDFNYPPDRLYSILDYKGEGLELLANRIALRQLDKQMITAQIPVSKAYLLRVMDPKWHGFFKKYDAQDDVRSPWLRTIYTASSLFTLLKLNHLQEDPEIVALIKPIAEFLLAMQLQSGENKGSFYYAFNTKTGEKKCEVVVGTASKTIFTLLMLHSSYPDSRYLEAATKAGDWLVKMVKDNGEVTPIANCASGKWQYYHQQSFLYSGQVLSALSRLYGVTKNPAYLNKASHIAQRMEMEMQRQQGFVGDDFREPNTISTSWVMMSLLDFVKVAPPNPNDKTILELAGSHILERQITQPNDVYNHGRYSDTMTTSGNGWINEVFSEYYPYCLQEKLTSCQNYKNAMLYTSRWLLQNVYSNKNTFLVKNPTMAIGGFIRNYRAQSVRTDAVCHGLNSLVNLQAFIQKDPETLVSLPQQAYQELIGLLRIGQIPIG